MRTMLQVLSSVALLSAAGCAISTEQDELGGDALGTEVRQRGQAVYGEMIYAPVGTIELHDGTYTIPGPNPGDPPIEKTIQRTHDYNYECSGAAVDAFDRMTRLGRVVAVSAGYADCMRELVTTGLAGTAWGPYAVQKNDPHQDKTRAQIAEIAIAQSRSLNDLLLACDDEFPQEAGWLLYAGTEEVGALPETVVGVEWFLQAVSSGFPVGGVRGAPTTDFYELGDDFRSLSGAGVWHEALHQHDWRHEPVTAEDKADPLFHLKSIPYIAGECLTEISTRSNACTVTCRPNQQPVARWDGTGCDCIFDWRDLHPCGRSGEAYAACQAPYGAANVGQQFGSALASADFNDDGFMDLAVGIPGKQVGDVQSGAVVIYEGSYQGLMPGKFLTPADFGVTFLGGMEFGASLAVARLDGDDEYDLVIGAPGYSNETGAIFVYAGSATGPAANSWVTGGGGRFGEQLLIARHGGAGEFKLAVSAPTFSTPTKSRAGAVTTMNLGLPLTAASTLFGGVTNGRLGTSLTSGDFGSSGTYPKLVAGEPGANRVVLMKQTASSFVYETVWNGPSGSAGFGSSVLQFTDGASSADQLAVGTTSSLNSFGTQTVYRLSNQGVVTTSESSTRPGFGSRLFKAKVDTALVNPDLIIGVPGDASVIANGSSYQLTDGSSMFATSMTVGDFNGDGRWQLVVGAPQLTVDGVQKGGFLVYDPLEDGSHYDLGAPYVTIDLKDELDVGAGVVIATNPSPKLPSFARFEATGQWNGAWSTLSLPLDSYRFTDGTASLALPAGYAEIVSSTFPSTAIAGVGAGLLLDVYVPAQQPTSGWQGQVAFYLSVTGANVNHASIGQAELAGLTKGQWHTVSVLLPASVRAALLGSYTSAQLYVAVNTDTGRPEAVRIDNLRFSSISQASSALSAEIDVTSEGNNWYCMNVATTNNAAIGASAWTVTVDSHSSAIFDHWNADLSGESGIVTLTPNQPWNMTLAAGEFDDSMGFCAYKNQGLYPTVVSTWAN